MGAAESFRLAVVLWLYCCVFSLQAVKSNVVNAGKIDAQLEQKVISACLKEVRQFPKRS